MGLRQQIQHIMGKDRRSSALTAYKNRGQIARLCDAIYEKYGLQNINHLKTKHIFGIMNEMKARGLGSSTLASYATAARRIAAAIGKQNIVPRTNKELGISRAGERLKPVTPNHEQISEIKTALYEKAEWLGLAADMRDKFGLRAKESLLSHEVNIKGQLIVRGTKGGRPRALAIRTPEQKELVERIRQYIIDNRQKSLIPSEMSLKQGLKAQSNAVSRLGGTKANNAHPHATRHGYAQKRTNEGISREQVSEELGHGRPDVVSHYLE